MTMPPRFPRGAHSLYRRADRSRANLALGSAVVRDVLDGPDLALGRRVGLEPDDLAPHGHGPLHFVLDQDLLEPHALGLAGCPLAERHLLLGAGHRRVRLVVRRWRPAAAPVV